MPADISSIVQVISVFSGLGGVVVAWVALMRHDPARAALVSELVDRTSRAIRDVDDLRRTYSMPNAYVSQIESVVNDPAFGPGPPERFAWTALREANSDFESSRSPLSLMELHADPMVAKYARAAFRRAIYANSNATVMLAFGASASRSDEELVSLRAEFSAWDPAEMRSSIDKLTGALLAVLEDPVSSLPPRRIQRALRYVRTRLRRQSSAV